MHITIDKIKHAVGTIGRVTIGPKQVKGEGSQRSVVELVVALKKQIESGTNPPVLATKIGPVIGIVTHVAHGDRDEILLGVLHLPGVIPTCIRVCPQDDGKTFYTAWFPSLDDYVPEPVPQYYAFTALRAGASLEYAIMGVGAEKNDVYEGRIEKLIRG